MVVCCIYYHIWPRIDYKSTIIKRNMKLTPNYNNNKVSEDDIYINVPTVYFKFYFKYNRK